MEMSMQDKVVVITGASRGLGFAMAEAFGAAGAKVVICSRTEASIAGAVESLRARGMVADGLACEVSDLAQVERLADFAEGAFGPIDVWVNNAGLSAPWGPSAHIPSDRFHSVLATNILGTYNGSVTAIRRFLPRGRGKLINLLGRGDSGAIPLQAAYSSSKSWVFQFTRALAREYAGKGLGIHGFNPGMVRTDMLGTVEALRGWEKGVEPLKYVTAIFGNETEVPAARALWLASPATDGKNGLMVRVIGPGFMLARGLAVLGRLITRRGLGAKELIVKLVEPAIRA